MAERTLIMGSYRFIDDQLWVGVPTQFPTDQGSTLVLADNKSIPYSFSFGIKHRGDETDILQSLVRIADERGDLWEGEAVWEVGEIVCRMTDLDTVSHPTAEAPKEWVLPFESPFFVGARGLIDDRFYRKIILDDEVHVLPMKYQGVVLDMAASSDESVTSLITILARVNGLYAIDDMENVQELPVITFEVDVKKRLFVNYGYQEDGHWTNGNVPTPFIMRKTGEKSKPNANVRLV